MGLEIFWTEFSEKELQNIFEYYKNKTTYSVAKKIINGIYNETLCLKKQPTIGQVEELLKQQKHEFRYLVYKNYKIIYCINYKKNRVEIHDVFDTRQNPPKLKRTE
ncbi:type II toxin-antitoxin system RelE/ParE family toxin [Lutibacter sp. HS1-25]|uniref:type II toxin-antitoxin system RelE/ParE family toxin n=1 Tax=Lutibacter sp. HS1-25 TaxID=2485000 RepID=UPI001012A0C5|nr:type II toxin-antitoxin system RelE/ParE family toxin [Lutibacter sp. HS1-25]RXP46074.1 type II toxin-antitoxin system RelE/ParE family toxin [Lutibacter sp. HS1-25]